MDGGFYQDEPDDQPYRVEARSGEFHIRDGRKIVSTGKAVKYSYRMVYTQKSIRMLDLRLDIAELPHVEELPELLRSAGITFLAHAIQGELDTLK